MVVELCDYLLLYLFVMARARTTAPTSMARKMRIRNVSKFGEQSLHFAAEKNSAFAVVIEPTATGRRAVVMTDARMLRSTAVITSAAPGPTLGVFVLLCTGSRFSRKFLDLGK